jgi:starch synthase (maltosyl-transferring)
MMPIGFEYGFRRRLNVVKTRPEDWETPAWDICDFVAAVNRLKESRRVFNEEGPIDALDLGNPKLFAFVKTSKVQRERAFIVLNKDRLNQQSFYTHPLGQFLTGTARVEDVSPEGKLMHSDNFQTCFLRPSGLNVLWAEAA